MAVYPEKIAKYLAADVPAPVCEPQARGAAASLECGSIAIAEVAVNNGSVSFAQFRTNGCGYMAAAGNILAKHVEGRPLAGLHGLRKEELFDIVETETEDFPPPRRQCLDIAVEAVRLAFQDFRRSRVAEYAGERALVCSCFGVGEDTIEMLAEKGVSTVEDVTSVCNAGGGCGSCRMLIQEIIDAAAERRL